MMEMSDYCQSLMKEEDMCWFASKVGGVLYVETAVQLLQKQQRLYAVSLDILVVSRCLRPKEKGWQAEMPDR